MTALVTIAAAGVLSWTLRASFITFLGDRKPPMAIRRGLAGARPAVMAAMVATSLTSTTGGASALAVSPELVAVAVAAAAVFVTRQLVAGLLAGVGALVGLGVVWPV